MGARPVHRRRGRGSSAARPDPDQCRVRATVDATAPGALPLGVLRTGERDPRRPRATAPVTLGTHVESSPVSRLSGSSARPWRARPRRLGEGAARCPGRASRGRDGPHVHDCEPALHQLRSRRRLADAELLRAAWFAVSEAQPEDVVVLAGDFNVTADRSSTLRDLTNDEWGFSEPGPGIDHILVRGAPSTPVRRWPDERRVHGGRILSDHAPVELDIR